MSKIPQLLTREERTEIMQKMAAKVPLTWEECDRLLDHIDNLESHIHYLQNPDNQ